MSKFLIVGPSWIGDMVMTHSLFIKLLERDKEAVIDVLAPNWSLPILARMPEVRRTIALPIHHRKWAFRVRQKIGYSLRSEHYDQAIILPRSWKSALIPFFAKAKHRVGFTGEQRYLLLHECRKLNKKILNQTVKRFVSLGLPEEVNNPPQSIPHPSLRVDMDNQQRLYDIHHLLPDRSAIALMPGAEYGPSKKWPTTYFRQLAEKIIQDGYQIWVLGGQKEADDGHKITDGLGKFAYNLCGKTQLVDTIDLLAATHKAVSNDSGLMHIAAAVGTEVHGIYGSTSALFAPPLTKKAVIHSLYLKCSPCLKRTCPFGHTKCQNDLKPDQIMSYLLPKHDK